MMKMIQFVLLLVLWGAFQCAGDPFQPEQIHLSYPDDPSQMMVTWSTLNDTSATVCEYGNDSWSFSVEGTRTLFVDRGEEQRAQYIHRANMTNLTPGQQYWYEVGSELGWSQRFRFTAMASGSFWSPRLILYGDMGNVNPQALPYVQKEVEGGEVDMVIHVGDFAYDLHSHNGETGNEFMRQIEEVAAYVPYMTCIGNHETHDNSSHYRNRFTMPQNGQNNMFYAFNLGPARFISFSTEFYFSDNEEALENQYNFLERELQEANLAENRALRPWVIVYAHRPLYCSNIEVLDDCDVTNNPIRIGIPPDQKFGVEELFYTYGVDLYVGGHEHSYERTLPVFNKTVVNGSDESDPYVDPEATVYITTGCGGSKKVPTPFLEYRPPWSAAHNMHYGYTRMQLANSTHLYLEQFSTENGGQIIDFMWMEKHRPLSQSFP